MIEENKIYYHKIKNHPVKVARYKGGEIATFQLLNDDLSVRKHWMSKTLFCDKGIGNIKHLETYENKQQLELF